MLQLETQLRPPRPIALRDRHGIPPGKPAAFDTRFLIVAGDRTVQVALSFMLEARGYAETRSVRSAARAAILLGDFQPDVVFIDLDLAARLRSMKSLDGLRLIALTDRPQHPAGDDPGHRGLERLLVKPVAQQALDEILHGPLAGVRRPRHLLAS